MKYMSKESRTLYLDSKEECDSFIHRLKQIQEEFIILVVPRQCKLFQSKGNLKRVKKVSQILNKRISIVSLNKNYINLASKVGINSGKNKSNSLVLNIFQNFWDVLLKCKSAGFNIWRNLYIYKKRTLGTTLIVVLICVIGTLFYFPQVVITVAARAEEVSSQFEIRVDRSAQDINYQNSVIPGRVITENVLKTQSFSATGKEYAREKGRGNVVIYNFTEDVLILESNKTVLKSGGKKYFFENDIRIRPTAHIGLDNKKIDLTSMASPVEIFAENDGPEYNLPANTKFEIENSDNTFNSSLIYAKNEAPIEGGKLEEWGVITQEDIDMALTELSKEIEDEGVQKLSKAVKKDEKLLFNNIQKKIVKKDISKKDGERGENFAVSLEVQLLGLVYQQRHLDKMIRSKIESSATFENYTFFKTPERTDFIVKEVNFDEGCGILFFNFKGLAYQSFDINNIENKIKGKTPIQIKGIINEVTQVQLKEIKFFRSLIKRAPFIKNHILINVFPLQNL